MWNKVGTAGAFSRYVANNKNYARTVANNKLCIGMHADHIALRILPTFLPEKR